jgi:hypothetical protein
MDEVSNEFVNSFQESTNISESLKTTPQNERKKSMEEMILEFTYRMKSTQSEDQAENVSNPPRKASKIVSVPLTFNAFYTLHGMEKLYGLVTLSGSTHQLSPYLMNVASFDLPSRVSSTTGLSINFDNGKFKYYFNKSTFKSFFDDARVEIPALVKDVLSKVLYGFHVNAVDFDTDAEITDIADVISAIKRCEISMKGMLDFYKDHGQSIPTDCNEDDERFVEGKTPTVYKVTVNEIEMNASEFVDVCKAMQTCQREVIV